MYLLLTLTPMTKSFHFYLWHSLLTTHMSILVHCHPLLPHLHVYHPRLFKLSLRPVLSVLLRFDPATPQMAQTPSATSPQITSTSSLVTVGFAITSSSAPLPRTQNSLTVVSLLLLRLVNMQQLPNANVVTPCLDPFRFWQKCTLISSLVTVLVVWATGMHFCLSIGLLTIWVFVFSRICPNKN